MELQKNNSKPAHLERLSQTTLCAALERNDFAAATAALPSKIEQAIEEPIISDVVKAVGEQKVILLVQVELAKLSERISVSGNITPVQLEFISGQLVSMFPNETIADFKICFERGAMGKYGNIFRMDGIVLRDWMNQYLDQKYIVVEEKLNKSKVGDPFFKAIDEPPINLQKDWLKVWENTINANPVGRQVPKMTEQEKKKWGGDQWDKIKLPLPTSSTYLESRAIHLAYVKANYHPNTVDMKLPGWMDEKDWIGGLTDDEKQEIISDFIRNCK